MEVGSEEEKKKLELIHVALQQLMEERSDGKIGEHLEEEDSRLLSRLISKLETLEEDASTTHLPKGPSGGEEASSSVAPAEARDCGTQDEIMRELRRVRKQNLITHCLLSVMIAVTAFWQFSEASMLLMLKEKFSNPLRTVSDMIMGSLKGLEKKPGVQGTSLPPVAVPELPHFDLPSLTLSNNDG